MMYAYGSKIKIDYNPRKVRYSREVELPDGLMKLSDISKHLKEGEEFGFNQRESNMFGSGGTVMVIYGYREETPEELSARIARAEKYNDNYEKFHAKYKRQ